MTIIENYQFAKQAYAKWGIDVEEVVEKLKKVPISIHCWQGDDIAGFEVNQYELSGGIDVTGNYPGKAKTAEELEVILKRH